MKYNNNKQEDIEIDDMKIKSHLNASLDLSGISVSEDLINRTLEAIKKQEPKQQEITQQEAEQQTAETEKTSQADEHRKVIPWNRYVRTFAGVAAAAIVVVAGYGLIKGGFTAQKSANSTDNAQMTYDTASTGSASDSTMSAATDTETADFAAESAAEDTVVSEEVTNAYTAKQDTSETEAAVEEPQYSITFNGDAEEEGSAYGTDGTVGTSSDTAAGTDVPMLKGTADISVLTFRDIVLADPDQASEITISDALNKITVTLTSKTDILDFYSVMDVQQFTYATEAASEADYVIEITAVPDQALYTMTVGDHVTVAYSTDETTSQSIYDAADLQGLKQALSDFCLKYSQ